MRKRNTIGRLAAGTVLIGGPLLGLGLAPGAASATACGTGGTTWSATHLGVPGGQGSITQADDWGGANTCLDVPGTTSASAGAFDIQSQTVVGTGGVLGYPNTSQGCAGGACSGSDTQLPVAVSTSPNPTITWSYNVSGAVTGSKYDGLIDSEFSAACTGTSPVMNEAIGVYTDGFPSYTAIGVPHSGTTVSIDGTAWYTGHFQSGSKFVSQFVRATPTTTGVSSLQLHPFYNWVKNNIGGSYWQTGDCLQQIATGFELWNGGQGLSSTGTTSNGTY